jgi:hypothetical protein
MERVAQVVGVQAALAVKVAWQSTVVQPVGVAREQVVPVVEVAADKVVVNVKQAGWKPAASGPVHSVCSKEYDLN